MEVESPSSMAAVGLGLEAGFGGELYAAGGIDLGFLSTIQQTRPSVWVDFGRSPA